MRKNKLEITGDGSHSVFSNDFQALYHSRHGAIQESMHVFIEAGLRFSESESLNILEMGFGTGLNALLTYIECEENNLHVQYDTIEAYPLELSSITSLNYLQKLDREDLNEEFMRMHTSSWNEEVIFGKFTLHKIEERLELASLSKSYDLVYYDAFAPLTQEELWTDEIFKKIAGHMNSNGILVSYCAKGSFKRALSNAGFEIHKIPGPPGKREMIRGVFRT